MKNTIIKAEGEPTPQLSKLTIKFLKNWAKLQTQYEKKEEELDEVYQKLVLIEEKGFNQLDKTQAYIFADLTRSDPEEVLKYIKQQEHAKWAI